MRNIIPTFPSTVFPEQKVWNHPHVWGFDRCFDFKHGDLQCSNSGAMFATTIKQKNIQLSAFCSSGTKD